MRKQTLAEADSIIDAALAKGRDLELGKLSVVVLDDGGHQIAMKREDGSEFMRPLIANAKAWGALGMGLPSRLLHERAKKLPVFIGALSEISDGRLVALPGGVIVRDADGHILGAVGVSVMSPNPMRCVLWREWWLQGSKPTSARIPVGTGPRSISCMGSFAVCNSIRRFV